MDNMISNASIQAIHKATYFSRGRMPEIFGKKPSRQTPYTGLRVYNYFSIKQTGSGEIFSLCLSRGWTYWDTQRVPLSVSSSSPGPADLCCSGIFPSSALHCSSDGQWLKILFFPVIDLFDFSLPFPYLLVNIF